MDNFQEFDNLNTKLEITGGINKNIAGLIDAILVIMFSNFIIYILSLLLIKIIEYSNGFNISIYIFTIFILYRITTILVFAKTIGMAILNIQFAKEDCLKLSKKEKIVAAFMIYLNGVNCYNIE